MNDGQIDRECPRFELREVHSGATEWVDVVALGEVAVVDASDASAGRSSLALTGHERGKVRVALAPDGERLALAGADRRMLIWDAAGDGRANETSSFGPATAPTTAARSRAR